MYGSKSDPFAVFNWFQEHDQIYGEVGAKILARIMAYEMQGQCFKYPRKKAAEMFDLSVDDFEYLINFLRDSGAVCLAGNAIVSSPYRARILQTFGCK